MRGLYAITAEQPPERLLADVQAAIQGGARIVQFRDKTPDGLAKTTVAVALLQLCRAASVPLLINDDVALAERIGADGVHLGQGDASLAQARERLGVHAIIGITCHDSLDLAASAAAGGADYLAFGACFASRTKPGARLCPLSRLTEARQLFNRPLVAIGGISPDNAAHVIAAGADALAVITGLWEAPDIVARARQFSLEFDRP